MLAPSRHLPQFARYLMSGGVATGVHYIVLVALVESSLLAPVPAAMIGAATAKLAWHYVGAQVAATIVVVTVTYQVNRRWTF